MGKGDVGTIPASINKGRKVASAFSYYLIVFLSLIICVFLFLSSIASIRAGFEPSLEDGQILVITSAGSAFITKFRAVFLY